MNRGARPVPRQTTSSSFGSGSFLDRRADDMNDTASPSEAQGRPVLNTQKPFGRTRPTNNQLL